MRLGITNWPKCKNKTNFAFLQFSKNKKIVFRSSSTDRTALRRATSSGLSTEFWSRPASGSPRSRRSCKASCSGFWQRSWTWFVCFFTEKRLFKSRNIDGIGSILVENSKVSIEFKYVNLSLYISLALSLSMFHFTISLPQSLTISFSISFSSSFSISNRVKIESNPKFEFVFRQVLARKKEVSKLPSQMDRWTFWTFRTEEG